MSDKKQEQAENDWNMAPPKRSSWENFQLFLWNSQTKEVLGRTALSWGNEPSYFCLMNFSFDAVGRRNLCRCIDLFEEPVGSVGEWLCKVVAATAGQCHGFLRASKSIRQAGSLCPCAVAMTTGHLLPFARSPPLPPSPPPNLRPQGVRISRLGL